MSQVHSVDGYGLSIMSEADLKEKVNRINLRLAGKDQSKSKSNPKIKIRPARTHSETYLELKPKRAGVVSNEVQSIAHADSRQGSTLVASGPLRLHAHRILALIISQIRPTKDIGFAEFRVPKNLLWEAIGGTARPTGATVEVVMKNLVHSVFTVRSDHKFTALPYMSEAEIDHDTGICRLRLNSAAMPYLLLDNPRNYRRLYFHSICKLRSVYAVSLYICLRRFVGRQHQLKHSITYCDLLDTLCVTSPYYTERWAEFQRDILIPAITEINTSTELRVSFTVERRGERGTVYAIGFTVNEDQRALNKMLTQAPEKSDRLLAFKPKTVKVIQQNDQYHDDEFAD